VAVSRPTDEPVLSGTVSRAAAFPPAESSHRAPASRAPRADGPIRVAFVIDNLGVGGTELNAVRTAEQLDPARVSLQVVTLQADGPMARRYAAAGIPVYPFNPGGSLVGVAALRQAAALARHFRQHRIDIVHCHDRYSNVFGGLAARLARRPAVIASKRWWQTSLPHRVLNAIAYRAADRVLCNSGAVAASARAIEFAPAKSLVVVPNFVDESAFDAVSADERAARRVALGVPADAPLVGIVAKLRPVKDHATLLRAFALLRQRVPAAWLLVAGDGPLQAELERLAVDLGIADGVRFPGLLPHLPNPHALFDVSVLCSRHEGFPNSVVEAMAAGRPVVATRNGGMLDAVRDGETGLLVPVGDAEALAAAIERLLAAPDERRRFGDAGQALASQRYRVAPVVGALQRLYDELVANPVLP
jgi:L-malate glycosyltransferase